MGIALTRICICFFSCSLSDCCTPTTVPGVGSHSSSAVRLNGQYFPCVLIYRSGKNLCSSSLFDFRMTVKCTGFSFSFTGLPLYMAGHGYHHFCNKHGRCWWVYQAWGLCSFCLSKWCLLHMGMLVAWCSDNACYALVLYTMTFSFKIISSSIPVDSGSIIKSDAVTQTWIAFTFRLVTVSRFYKIFSDSFNY